MKMQSDRKDLSIQWLLNPIVEELEKITKAIDSQKDAPTIDMLDKMRVFFDEDIEEQILDVMYSNGKYKKNKNASTQNALLATVSILITSLHELTKPSHLSTKDITLLQYISTELMMIRDMIQIESGDYSEQATFGLAGLSKSLQPLSKRAGGALELIASYMQSFSSNKAEKLSADARAVMSRIIVATEVFVENLITLEFKFDSVYDRVESDILWLSSHIKRETPRTEIQDPEIVAIFYEELEEETGIIVGHLKALQNETTAKQALKDITNSVHTLKGSSIIMGARNLSAYAEEIEFLLKKSAEVSELPVEDIQDEVQFFCEEIFSHLNNPNHTLDITRVPAAPIKNAPPSKIQPEVAPVIPTTKEKEQVDPEILAIFLDEAQDIMARVEETFEKWRSDLNNKEYVADLHRELHTLKGGARMVGQESIADVSHELERLYNLMTEERSYPSPEDFSVIADCHDKVAIMLDNFKDGVPVASSVPIIQKLRKHFGLAADESEPKTSMSAQIKKQQDIVISKISEKKEEKKTERRAPDSERKLTQEMVRVSAVELEALYHVSGEVSVSRENMVQNVLYLNRVGSDLGLLSKRLSEQIRQLEIQTDLQLLNQPALPSNDVQSDFDPLEFDRYSRIQQLTRSMSETLSDFLSRRDEQYKILKTLDNILHEQQKNQNELRTGLLRTQLVYFSSIFPRLNRIVKQTADELNKKCELIANKLDIEIDRNLLNHLLAPLEHMLRNAVDHGIESPDERVSSGKKEMGVITISLRREGGEVFIDVTDDGAGISIEAVKSKAIEKKMMKVNEVLNKNQILRFILTSGFSTKESVTQISGRGVGMDVVYNEVKQLGGHLLIETDEGKRTSFTIHLPFTQSLHRALIFKVESEQYLLQLSSILAIARIDHAQAEKFIKEPGSVYEQGTDRYAVIYCGNLLASGEKIREPSLKARYPILLLRTRGTNLGLLVDEIEGSREILLKSLSPELRQLRLIAGATELNEGVLSFILDPEGLVERAEALYKIFASEGDAEQPQLTDKVKKLLPSEIRVLVVDDSMTVRRVTSRFLMAKGFVVDSAKDGVDALAAMELEKPNVVLMDVEMPRMDGFECVAKIKADPKFKNIPVIMISSRTAQKHRDHASTLGVKHYFGKPYQEEAVLKAIIEVTEVKK